jgi:hypothetical protein
LLTLTLELVILGLKGLGSCVLVLCLTLQVILLGLKLGDLLINELYDRELLIKLPSLLCKLVAELRHFSS